MKDPYKDLRYHINVIEEGLYPIAEFCIKTTLRVMNLFDHLFDHRKNSKRITSYLWKV